MTSIKLSRMESLAMSGVEFRFRRETQDAISRRNQDLLAVLEEHGHHNIPPTFVLRLDADGYAYAIEWGHEIGDEECDHNHG